MGKLWTLILTSIFLVNVRMEIVSKPVFGLLVLIVIWVINVRLVLAPKASSLPSFFFFMATIIEILPKAALCLIGNQAGACFTCLNIILYIVVFFGSMGENSEIVLSKEEHFRFLITVIIQQTYSTVMNSLLKVETGISCELFEKIFKIVQSKSQEKTNFISRMSHELRTPLHGLLSSVDLLKHTPMDEEQSTYLSAIDSCGGLLLDTIVKILDISQIESGKFYSELTSFSLYTLIQNVVEPVSILATRKNIDINVNFDFNPLGFDVHGDQTHLKEIILNVYFFFLLFFF